MTTTSCTNTLYAETVWKSWCTATTATTDTWIQWNAEWACTSTEHYVAVCAPRVAPAIEVITKPAEDRAEVLLRSLLSPEQRSAYDLHKHFDVRAQSGRIYRLHRGPVRNVHVLDHGGQGIRGYCIHPRETVPVADVLVAQKLMLEADEQEFLRIANAFSVN